MTKTNAQHHRALACTTWLLQLLTITLLAIQIGVPVQANPHKTIDDLTVFQENNDELVDEPTLKSMDEVKRSWQSLQGSWGKRDQGSLRSSSSYDDYDNLISKWVSEYKPIDYKDHPQDHSLIYASSPNALASVAAAAASAASAASTDGDMFLDGHSRAANSEKRSWKNMNVAWGKRRSAVWNKFRGAWGKRESGWNNLKGMWGKRSTGDWKKLQSAWGKRSHQQ